MPEAFATPDAYHTLGQSRKLFPNRPHLASIWRWATKGVRGKRLRTTMIGGRRFTTAADVAEFLADCNATSGPVLLPTPAELSQRQKRAAAVLDRAGI